jgi:bacteriocin biosynthesis cyclodehydratase domain-containing protein
VRIYKKSLRSQRIDTNRFKRIERILPKIPKFVEGLDIIEGENSLQFRGSEKPILLTGEMTKSLVPSLLKMINGKSTLQQIVSKFSKDDKHKVYYALLLLGQNGLLEDEAAIAKSRDQFTTYELDKYRSQLAFFSKYLNVTKGYNSRYEIQLVLKDSNVLLLGAGAAMESIAQLLSDIGVGHIILVKPESYPKQALEHLLESKRFSNIEIVQTKITCSEDISSILKGRTIDLFSVVTPRPFPALYAWVNTACVHKRVTWTRMTISEREILIGPTIVPFETACYTCFDTRFQANNLFFEEDQNYAEYLNRSGEHIPQEFSLICELSSRIFVFEVLRILTFFSLPVTYSALYSMDLLNGKTQVSRVIKMPRCTSCSTINLNPRRHPMPGFANG